MKRVFRATLGLLGVMLIFAGSSLAAQRSTFIVLPFAVHGPSSYSYLERSIPSMMTSRLFTAGVLEQARELPTNAKIPASDTEAEKMRAQYKADYVVWGTVTIVNDMASLDVRVRDKKGKIWPLARESRAPQLMAAISGVSDAIRSEVFGLAGRNLAAAPSQGGGRINQMNPDITINQTTAGEVYLNPQFRYSGGSTENDSRLRSQALSFSSIGMEVVDADGDGKNEILLLTNNSMHAYSFDQGKLTPLGEVKFPMTSQCLTIRSLPRPSGRPWIIVNTVDRTKQPYAFIYTFSGNGFKEEMRDIRWYLNVVKLPPSYQPVLIGQQAQPPRLFKQGVYEMIKQGKELAPSKRIDLPKGANLFNFTYLPGARGEIGADKLVMLTGQERLRIFNAKGSVMAETSESYSGAAVGMEIDPTMSGLGKEDVTIPTIFFIPMRMLAMDLERDGKYELIVNKPISTASQIFDRYRSFPQSEIHSLFWDGIGMNLQWKTRRIKGSMADYTIADANNDGVPDLVTCVNTHPGALGVKARKTVIMLYPLDVSLTNPNVNVDKSEFYD